MPKKRVALCAAMLALGCGVMLRSLSEPVEPLSQGSLPAISDDPAPHLARREVSPADVVVSTKIRAAVSVVEEQRIAELGEIRLRFCDMEAGHAVPSLAVSLLDADTGRLLRRGLSDDEGLVVFPRLPAGQYRWRLDSRADIDFVPPFEKKADEPITGGFRVRRIPQNLSGVVEVDSGDCRNFNCQVRQPITVKGRLVYRGEAAEGAAYVKLLNRKVSTNSAGEKLDRCLKRMSVSTRNGLFHFEGASSGEQELLVRWRDQNGAWRFLKRNFRARPGENVDLGDLAFPKGLTARLEIRPVDDSGRVIEALCGERLMLVEPSEPDADWPYMPERLPVGRPFELAGLRSGAWKLSELEAVLESSGSWERSAQPDFQFEPGEERLIVLEEQYVRKHNVLLDVLIPGPPGSYRCSLVTRGRGQRLQRSRKVLSSAHGRIGVTAAGRQAVLLLCARHVKSGRAFSARLSLDLSGEQETIRSVALQPAAIVTGRSEAGGVLASPADLAEGGAWAWRVACEEGAFRLIVHPGAIRFKGVRSVFAVAPGEERDVGIIPTESR